MDKSLVTLYQNESLKDSFFTSVSPDGKHIATGAYNNAGHVLDIDATTNSSVTCNFD